jgi:hypothetical protein
VTPDNLLNFVTRPINLKYPLTYRPKKTRRLGWRKRKNARQDRSVVALYSIVGGCSDDSSTDG